MKKIKLTLTLPVLLPVLVGCTSLGQLDGSASSPREDESIFVMGVAPDNYRISMFPGSVEDGRFYQSPIRNAILYAAAKDGYVVGKANAGEVLGLANIKVVSGSESLLGRSYKACGEEKTIVFKVPKGKIVYLGDLSFLYGNNTLDISYRDAFEAARTYVDKNFPALRGKLESFQIEWATHLKSCGAGGGTIIIPLHIRSK